MDAVRASVKSVLPSISDDVLDNLIRKLDGDGIESLADCCFLNESDLVDILKRFESCWLIGKQVICLFLQCVEYTLFIKSRVYYRFLMNCVGVCVTS